LHLFAQITGGKVASGIVDAYPGKAPRRSIDLAAARITQVLGIEVPQADVLRILRSLGFSCELVAGEVFRAEAPDWRPDVELPDDLVEEIGRIYGYDKLPTTMLRGSLPEVEPRPLEDLREEVRDLAAALGFEEIITYTLTDRAQLSRVVEPGDAVRGEPLGVVNPVAAQHTFLRTSLRAGVLSTYAANRRHDDGPLRLFEIGFEYLPVEADLPHERTVLCAAIGGPRETRWGRPGGERLDFFDAKGAVQGVLDALGIDAGFAATTGYGLLSGHAAGITTGKTDIGVVAQVHPETAAAFDIAEPVFLVELWIEPMVAALPERPAYFAPSKFPEVRQDIAILVDEATPAGKLLRLARSHRAGSIRVEAEVFDEYRGAGVPAGKKSLALGLRYQASDRTLTDEDVARVQGGLMKRLGSEFGATLRGTA
jgi:phenylalanyl-tRNA synthetase beta chain